MHPATQAHAVNPRKYLSLLLALVLAGFALAAARAEVPVKVYVNRRM